MIFRMVIEKRKQKVESSIFRVQGSKKYIELMDKMNKNLDFWSTAVQNVTGMNKDEVLCEIQAVYLQNLKKADDLKALAEENIATLMMKEQVKTHILQKVLQNAYDEAKDSGDEERIKQAEADLLENLVDTSKDFKLAKAINDSIKILSSLKPAIKKADDSNHDDKMVFDIKENMYIDD